MSYVTREELRAARLPGGPTPWVETCAGCNTDFVVSRERESLEQFDLGFGPAPTCNGCIAEYRKPQVCAGLCGETGIRGEMVKVGDLYYCEDDAMLRRLVIAGREFLENAA